MFSHIGRMLGDKRPVTADIFLNNYCNNACPYCTYKRWELDSDAYYMRYDDFVKYAERLLEIGVLGFILTGGGEPTISRDFKAITNWLQDRRIHYGINTNFNKLVYIKPDYLKVSLDAWDEDSYERKRGVRQYETVRENIKKYAAWKKENSQNTSLGIQCVVQSVEDINKFYLANSDLPVDYIVFRPQESTGGSVYTGINISDIVSKVKGSVSKLAEKDKRVTLNFKWNLIGVQETSCLASWAQIALNEKGEVMYCCHKPYQVIGNILDPDILEKKNNARTDMRTCDIPCRMTAPNRFVAQAMAERKDACFI